MKIANTTGDYGKTTLTLEKILEHLKNAGFRYIDLSLYSIHKGNSEFMSDNWQEYADKIKNKAGELGLTFVQAHSPGINPLECTENEVKAMIRSIEICGFLGIKNTVYHAGWAPEISKEEFFERNREFYRRLIPTMEETGVNVLIENSTKANMGDMYYFLTGQDMKEFIEYVGHPQIGACWDTGHANIEGHQYEDLVTLGKYLKAVHINDNHSMRDDHIMPFLGRMSVDEVMNGLIDAGFGGYFTFEADSSIISHDHWLGHRRSFEKDTRLADAPIAVRDKLEEALYLTGECILKAYDCFEE